MSRPAPGARRSASGAHRYDPAIARFLDEVLRACASPRRLVRDPLAIVAEYADPADIEVAGLVASTLAFGAVDLIMRAAREALAPLGPHPAAALDSMSDRDIEGAWRDFRYRFCAPSDLQGLMRAIARARRDHGSLESLFARGDLDPRFPDRQSPDIVDATGAFVDALRAYATIRTNLLPHPRDGSACKRLFLYLRWMARRDGVDPGPWTSVSPARLVVPMDVHMFRTCRDRLGFFGSGSRVEAPRLAHALAATAAFRLYAPDDPVRFDFALTRPGIDPRPGDEAFACG